MFVYAKGKKNMEIHKMILSNLETHGLRDTDKNYMCENKLFKGNIIFLILNKVIYGKYCYESR